MRLIYETVKQNRPFTEILTKDCIYVNEYTKYLFGVSQFGNTAPNPNSDAEMTYLKDVLFNQAQGKFVNDRKETALDNRWSCVTLPGIPTSGILTNLGWLAARPTTDTNLNRHRAHMILKNFLDFDIELLGGRPLTSTGDSIENPTYNDPACTSCHSILDPLAGLFKNFQTSDVLGRFIANSPWAPTGYLQMLAPGFQGEALPASMGSSSVKFLASKIIAQDKFPLSLCKFAYKTITGKEPTVVDTGSKNLSEKKFLDELIKKESVLFKDCANSLKENNFNIKFAYASLLSSKYLNAVSLNIDTPTTTQLVAYSHAGVGRMLDPNQLSKKLRAVTATTCTKINPDSNYDYLYESYFERLNFEMTMFGGTVAANQVNKGLGPRNERLQKYSFTDYGGVNYLETVEPSFEFSSLSASIASKMAYRCACRNVVKEFNAATRSLFPSNTNLVLAPTQESEVRNIIKTLFQKATLKTYAANDELITLAFNLYTEVYNSTPATDTIATATQCQADGVSGTLNADIKAKKAWSAVLANILGSWDFLTL